MRRRSDAARIRRRHRRGGVVTARRSVSPPARAPGRLPTYRLPVERAMLPKACHRCGGRLLDLDQARGEAVFGRLVCVLCSEQLCWIRGGRDA